MFEEIEEAYETVYRSPGVNRIEGGKPEYDFQWKVYRVAGDIIRIDIKPKENGSGN